MKPISDSVKEFCESADLMRLSYIDQQGRPRVVPVWFTVIEGVYYFGTYLSAPKTAALRANPRVAWVVDGGIRPRLLGATYSGHVQEIADLKLREAIYQRLGEKYYGSTDDAEFLRLYGVVNDPDTLYFKLIAETETGWEYS